jgi:hypothetical protein
MINRFLLVPFVCAAVLFFCAARADAQQITVTTEPPVPRAGEPVTLIVTSVCSCPDHDYLFVRNGSTIDIATGDGCRSACISDDVERYNLGVLPPGVYTVRNYRISRPAELTVIGTFAVTEGAPIPTLSEWAMAALVLLLTAAGAVHLRR